MWMTLGAAMACTFLSAFANPALARADCREDYVPELVTRADDWVRLTVVQAAGKRAKWGEVSINEVSAGPGVPAVLWGDQLQRVVTGVTDRIHVKLLKPSGLVISYVVTF